jgi:hypothetical protein
MRHGAQVAVNSGRPARDSEPNSGRVRKYNGILVRKDLDGWRVRWEGGGYGTGIPENEITLLDSPSPGSAEDKLLAVDAQRPAMEQEIRHRAQPAIQVSYDKCLADGLCYYDANGQKCNSKAKGRCNFTHTHASNTGSQGEGWYVSSHRCRFCLCVWPSSPICSSCRSVRHLNGRVTKLEERMVTFPDWMFVGFWVEAFAWLGMHSAGP